MTSQQRRLSNTEVASYFKKLWSGDETAGTALLNGNMYWVAQLVTPLAEQSAIPIADFLDAGAAGLAAAIDKYSDAEHQFQPDANLEGGYAIWWVRMAIMRLANENGYDYSAATNAISPSSGKA